MSLQKSAFTACQSVLAPGMPACKSVRCNQRIALIPAGDTPGVFPSRQAPRGPASRHARGARLGSGACPRTTASRSSSRSGRRSATSRSARRGRPRRARPRPQIVREAATFPQGPSFLSAGWRSTDAHAPQLVTAIVTRLAPGGILIPSIALVDRTCLGIKNGFVGRPATRAELDTWLARIRRRARGRRGGGSPDGPVDRLQRRRLRPIPRLRAAPGLPRAPLRPAPGHAPRHPPRAPARPVYVSGPDDDPVPHPRSAHPRRGRGELRLDGRSRASVRRRRRGRATT